MSTGICLDEASVTAVARQVAELLLGKGVMSEETVDASEMLVGTSEIARRFGVSTDYVYRHAEELGVIRLGNGRKPRLRFDPVTVREQLEHRAVREPKGDIQREGRHPVRRMRSGDLVPIKGESP